MKTIARTFVSDIQPQSQVRQVFRVLDKQHRANRQGNMYLLMQLGDKSGVISGIRWNSDQRLYDSFQKGDYLQIFGVAQLHNGLLQIIVNDFDWIDPSQIDAADFQANDPAKIDAQWQEFVDVADTITNPTLRAIAQHICNEPAIAQRLKLAPAGVKTHHAYPGGLVFHMLDLIRIGDFLSQWYSALNRDLLLVGTMLHDIGKIEELAFESELTYTDAGQLLGHLVQGVSMLDGIVSAVQRDTGLTADAQLVLRLKHMIVSHHGMLEHGSPKVPMTIEAIVLAHIDDLDAKVNAASETIRSDRNSDSAWTAFHPTLGRKLFKPSLEE